MPVPGSCFPLVFLSPSLSGQGSEGGKWGKDLNSERGGRSQGGKGEDLGKKCLKGERGEKIFGRKREIFLGGNRP